jgi:hypothetical protein
MDGYRTQSPDTPIEIERRMIEHFRSMSGGDKLRMVFELQAAADALSLADIRERHPGISDHEANLRLASRKYDRELLIAAYGWDPLAHGEHRQLEVPLYPSDLSVARLLTKRPTRSDATATQDRSPPAE